MPYTLPFVAISAAVDFLNHLMFDYFREYPMRDDVTGKVFVVRLSSVFCVVRPVRDDKLTTRAAGMQAGFGARLRAAVMRRMHLVCTVH